MNNTEGSSWSTGSFGSVCTSGCHDSDNHESSDNENVRRQAPAQKVRNRAKSQESINPSSVAEVENHLQALKVEGALSPTAVVDRKVSKSESHHSSSSETFVEEKMRGQVLKQTHTDLVQEQQSVNQKPKEMYLNIASLLVSRQFSQEDVAKIDDFSMENMALALEFSKVDCIEKADALNLKIIPPPNTVFYTWTAEYKTTIFDGVNNPEKHKGINYVGKIENQNFLILKVFLFWLFIPSPI